MPDAEYGGGNYNSGYGSGASRGGTSSSSTGRDNGTRDSVGSNAPGGSGGSYGGGGYGGNTGERDGGTRGGVGGNAPGGSYGGGSTSNNGFGGTGNRGPTGPNGERSVTNGPTGYSGAARGSDYSGGKSPQIGGSYNSGYGRAAPSPQSNVSTKGDLGTTTYGRTISDAAGKGNLQSIGSVSPTGLRGPTGPAGQRSVTNGPTGVSPGRTVSNAATKSDLYSVGASPGYASPAGSYGTPTGYNSPTATAFGDLPMLHEVKPPAEEIAAAQLAGMFSPQFANDIANAVQGVKAPVAYSGDRVSGIGPMMDGRAPTALSMQGMIGDPTNLTPTRNFVGQSGVVASKDQARAGTAAQPVTGDIARNAFDTMRGEVPSYSAAIGGNFPSLSIGAPGTQLAAGYTPDSYSVGGQPVAAGDIGRTVSNPLGKGDLQSPSQVADLSGPAHPASRPHPFDIAGIRGLIAGAVGGAFASPAMSGDTLGGAPGFSGAPTEVVDPSIGGPSTGYEAPSQQGTQQQGSTSVSPSRGGRTNELETISPNDYGRNIPTRNNGDTTGFPNGRPSDTGNNPPADNGKPANAQPNTTGVMPWDTPEFLRLAEQMKKAGIEYTAKDFVRDFYLTRALAPPSYNPIFIPNKPAAA